MKAILIALLLLFALPTAVYAQPANAVIAEGDSNWPGVIYQIIALKRIPPERLLIAIRVVATAQAPPQGTAIGVPVPIPPNADKYAIKSGIYHPRPLSFASSVMTDELTKQTFPALHTISPPGHKYISSSILSTLMPGGATVLVLQFAIPPPPPPDQLAAGHKQTLSFLFTNAKGPIAHVPIPPPLQAPEAAR